MPKVCRPDGTLRTSTNYLKAKELLQQKRAVLSRLNEINRLLRDLREQSPDAVSAANIDVPVRNSPGRPRRT
jgi:hypothetical protein